MSAECMPSQLTVTPTAEKEMRRVVNEKNEQADAVTDSLVRLFVVGGGCSGFQYGFSLDERRPSDVVVFSALLCVDPISFLYLNQATIDHNGSRFVVDNPNKMTSCAGCGR